MNNQSKRTYPYTAWTLTPSFKPKQVTLVRNYHSGFGGDWDQIEEGRLYSAADLFPTRDAAIDAGWTRIHEQEAKLAKMQDRINKKRENLAKAMGA